MAKGRATGYSDFFKGNTKTLADDVYGEDDDAPKRRPGISIQINTDTPTSKTMDERRKEALKRRLLKKKVGK